MGSSFVPFDEGYVDDLVSSFFGYIRDVDLSDYSRLDFTNLLVIFATFYHIFNAFLTLRTIKRPIRSAIKLFGLAITLSSTAKTYLYFKGLLGYLLAQHMDLHLPDFSTSQMYGLLWVYPNLINLIISAVVLLLSICGFLARIVGFLVCA